MPVIDEKILIKSPRESIYQISQDYKVRHAWDPFPDKLVMADSSDYFAERGKRVYVRSKLYHSMVVEFVQVQAPSCVAVVMVQGPWFLKKFAGSWIINETRAGMTQVRFHYVLATRPAWLNKLACIYFSRVVRNRLAALKKYCEQQ